MPFDTDEAIRLVGERSTKQALSLPHSIIVTITAALIIVHVEISYAYRSLFWPGTIGVEWLGPLAAVGFIAIVIAITALVTTVVARLLIPASRKRSVEFVTTALAISPAIAIAYFLIGDLPVVMPALQCIALILVSLFAMIFGPNLLKLSRESIIWILFFAAASAGAVTYSLAVTLYPFPEIRSTTLKFVTPTSVLLFAAIIAIGQIATRRSSHANAYRLGVIGLTLLAATLAPPFAARISRGTAPSVNRPNLVLITCDALRADYCSPYGGEISTPAMASIANAGTNFDAAYSLAPWTVPSMFGMFSSTYPPALMPDAPFETWLKQVTKYRMPTGQSLLAERLRDTGYSTAAYVGNPLLDDTTGILRGFDVTYGWPSQVPYPKGPFAMTPGMHAIVSQLTGRNQALPPFDSTRILRRTAVAYLRSVAREPFFLWVHIMDPHDPYDPPSEFRSTKGPWPLFGLAAPYWGTPQRDERGNIVVETEHQAYVRTLYQGEIAYADACIEAILNELETFGGDRNTFVCFVADHGEELWDHDRYGHGHSLYDELVHVPMMFSGPGIVRQSIDQPASTIDIMPTLAALMNVDADPNWRGHDLSPLLLQSQETPRSPVIAQATNRNAWPDVLRMYRDGQWKLIDTLGKGPTALYDMHNDPLEQNNLLNTHPEIVAELTIALEEWELEFPPAYNLTDDSNDAVPEAEMLENLRSLGYIK